jgi:hypothetical protein
MKPMSERMFEEMQHRSNYGRTSEREVARLSRRHTTSAGRPASRPSGSEQASHWPDHPNPSPGISRRAVCAGSRLGAEEREHKSGAGEWSNRQKSIATRR